MRDQKHKPIRRALRDEQRRLATQAYPGDLAIDVLHDQAELGLVQRLRTPAFAVALLGIGVTMAIGLLLENEQPEPGNHTLTQQRVAEQPTQTVAPAQPTITPAPAPTAVAATAALPEIDRELLPLQRNAKATWLASAKSHTQQIDKQSRYAEHPSLSKRARLTLSAPTRRTIGRTFDRPLSLKPVPQPERNS